MSMQTPRRSFGSVTKRLAAAGLALTASVTLLDTAAYAGPVGQEVVIGDVTFIQDGNQWMITASDGSIINYLSFDILPAEMIQFIQPGANARVLNRINSDTPTQIMGTLLSNGFIYFVNPSGVIFGANSVVDTGGLIAAAGNMSNSDFANGIDRFTGVSGDVSNAGSIAADTVYLVGRHVANSGLIESEGGIVAMVAADNRVRLSTINGRLSVWVDGTKITDRAVPISSAINGTDVGVVNSGTINAGNGQVVLGAGDFAGLAVHNLGSVLAASGDVQMVASGGIIRNEGTVDVSGNGGQIIMQGAGVDQRGALRADSTGMVAGSIKLFGHLYTVLLPESITSAAGTGQTSIGGTVVIDALSGTAYVANDSVIDIRGGALAGHGGSLEVGGPGIVVNGTLLLDSGSGAEAGTFTLIGEGGDVIIGDDGSNDDLLFDDGNVTIDELPGGNAFISAATLGQITDGSILIQSNGHIFLMTNLALVDPTDLTLQAAFDVFLEGVITGADDLLVQANFTGQNFGTVHVNVPIDVSGSIELSGDIIRLDGGTLDAGGQIRFNGETLLAQNTTMSGTSVSFNGTLNTTGQGPEGGGYFPWTLNVTGDTTFSGAVGNNSPLGSVTVNGDTTVLGGEVTTYGDQTYNGDTVVGGATVFNSLGGIDEGDQPGGDGGDIRFLGTLDAIGAGESGSGSVTVNTTGTTEFAGTVGGNGLMTSVDTDAGGTTILGADVTAEQIRLRDAVELAADVTLTGSTRVELTGGGVGNGNDLTINSGNTRIEGGWTDLGVLITDASGTTKVSGEIVGDQLIFRDQVQLLNDSQLTGLELVHFGNQIFGTHNLEVMSDVRVEFMGNVGPSISPLQSLVIRVNEDGSIIDQNLIVFGPNVNRIFTFDDILINPDGRDQVSSVATIVILNNVAFGMTSANGKIQIGPREKLTALGSLRMEAQDGSVAFGDLTILGDLEVISDDITIHAREGGMVRRADGTFFMDGGTDIIVGGNMASFSSVPQVSFLNADAVAPRVGTPSATLEGFGDLESEVIDPISQDDVLVYFIGKGETELVLDLGLEAAIMPVPPGPTPPPPGPAPTPGPEGEFEGSLAEFTGDEIIRRFADPIQSRVLRDPIVAETLRRLALVIRNLRPEELRTLPEGRLITVDTADPVVVSGGRAPTGASRIRRSALLATANRIDALLGPAEDAEADAAAATIREALGMGWAAWRQSGSGNEAADFIAWLETSEEHAGAAFAVAALRDIARSVRSMGLTASEADAALRPLLRTLTPTGTGADFMEAVLRVR